MTENVFSSLIMPMFGVLLIILLAYWGTKWLAKRYNRLGHGRYMRVIERVALGQDRFLLLVELAGKIYFLGIGPKSVETLHILTEDEVTKLPPQRESDGEFSHILADLLKKPPFTAGKRSGNGRGGEER